MTADDSWCQLLTSDYELFLADYWFPGPNWHLWYYQAWLAMAWLANAWLAKWQLMMADVSCWQLILNFLSSYISYSGPTWQLLHHRWGCDLARLAWKVCCNGEREKERDTPNIVLTQPARLDLTGLELSNKSLANIFCNTLGMRYTHDLTLCHKSLCITFWTWNSQFRICWSNVMSVNGKYNDGIVFVKQQPHSIQFREG